MSCSSDKSLVLVVGAGASKEVNLPTGFELKNQIARLLNIRFNGSGFTSGDGVIYDALCLLAWKENPNGKFIRPYVDAALRIHDAMPQSISIDNFIDSHRTDEKIATCGKLAIARCILEAESKSSLYVDLRNTNKKINFTKVSQTWINAFFQLLTQSTQQTELPEKLSKIAIICFNYDRCIEHYLHSAFRNYYGMSSEVATDTLKHLEIHHPYGTVGKLPWPEPRGRFEYGATPEAQDLVTLVGELRTFTEGIDPKKSDINAIRSTLVTAKRIAFLGFAFHPLNIELLFSNQIQTITRNNCKVYGTAYGISPTDSQMIKQELFAYTGIHQEHINLRNDLTCFQLFGEFSRSLSLQ